MVISAKAVVTECSGRRITFTVSAADSNGDMIGEGTIERFVVNENKFMKKAGTNEV